MDSSHTHLFTAMMVDILRVLCTTDEIKLPFYMPFTMQCISSDYESLGALSPANLRGDHFHQDLHSPPLQKLAMLMPA